MNDQPVCYLCGEPISAKDFSKDHFPAKQFVPKAVRKAHNLDRLTTLPSHGACNTAYSADEEYFRLSVGTLGNGNPVADAVFDDARAGARRPGRSGLLSTVLAEFSNQTSGGVILPAGTIAKRFDVARVDRVVWKTVRGLHFFERNEILKEECRHQIFLFHPALGDLSDLEPLRSLVVNLPQDGAYPGLFAYKWAECPDAPGLFLCGLLFWDCVFFIVIYHAGNCACPHCAPAGASPSTPA